MVNIKKILCLFLISVLLLSFAGCTKSTVKEGASADTITVTDHNGNTVKLPAHIERIAVCDIYPLPSVLAVFFDSAKRITGMPEPSMSAAKNSLLSKLYPEILNAQTGFINGSEVNIEELSRLKPDVVFYSASNKAQGEKLTGAGFNAVAISVNKWDYDAIKTLNNWISLLSRIFPDNDKAKTVESYSSKIYSMVQSRVAKLTESERARVFFLFQYKGNSISTSGKHFFGQWWAESVGAVNVSGEIDKDNAVQVNMEQIYKWNPDKIFITNFTTAQPEDLYYNKIGSFDWSGVKAVQAKQAYKMPLGMYRSYTPGVDTPITLMWLAKSVYPKLFEDIDITSEVKKYYKAVFEIELTDKQAESIFTPASGAAGGL